MALGLSREALAHGAGLHRTYGASLETGERNPDLVARLALALGCDAGDLVAGLEGLPGQRDHRKER